MIIHYKWQQGLAAIKQDLWQEGNAQVGVNVLTDKAIQLIERKLAKEHNCVLVFGANLILCGYIPTRTKGRPHV